MLEDVQITKIEKFNDLFLRILKQMRSWITLKKKKRMHKMACQYQTQANKKDNIPTFTVHLYDKLHQLH